MRVKYFERIFITFLNKNLDEALALVAAYKSNRFKVTDFQKSRASDKADETGYYELEKEQVLRDEK